MKLLVNVTVLLANAAVATLPTVIVPDGALIVGVLEPTWTPESTVKPSVPITFTASMISSILEDRTFVFGIYAPKNCLGDVFSIGM